MTLKWGMYDAGLSNATWPGMKATHRLCALDPTRLDHCFADIIQFVEPKSIVPKLFVVRTSKNNFNDAFEVANIPTGMDLIAHLFIIQGE